MSEGKSEHRNQNVRDRGVYGWQALVLFSVWVLLSGKFDLFHLGTGLVMVAYVVWQHSRLPIPPGAIRSGRRPLRAVVYFFWLFWQMILAAIYVARVILSPKKHLNPEMIAFHSEQPSLFHSVILAHSITLTPGTLTVELEDNRYLVHGLTPSTAKDVLDGDMAARVARLCSDDPIPAPKELAVPKGGYAT